MANAEITFPLLSLLGGSPSQSLSRGELRRLGITDNMIEIAGHREYITFSNKSLDDTRDGLRSSIVNVILTDVGEKVLDEAGV